MTDAPASAPLWTSDEVVAATGGVLHGAPFHVSGVSFDTRELAPGDLFVALGGERDGHDFVAAAFDKGAAGTLVSRPVECGPAVQAADTLRALEALGAAARDRAGEARRIAVTGSVGKTSVTQALLAALSLAGPAHGSVKSFNNHIGVPLTLARMPRETRFAVFEVGMNHAEEIRPLSRLVRPHVAVVTTVGPVHTENFHDGEAGVARAKAEVFDGLEPGGAAVIDGDNRWAGVLREAAQAAGARVLTFGTGEGADARLMASEPGVVLAKLNGRTLRFPIAQTGAHWGRNALAVLLALDAAGAPVEAGVEALADFAPLAGRGAERRIPLPGGGELLLIDESYNANPLSMRAALETLSRREGRRIAVLTDMLELGPRASELHGELKGPLEQAEVDLVFAAGPLMRDLYEQLPHAMQGAWSETAAELAPRVRAAVRDGDVVMAKGSNGSKASLVVRALERLGGPAAGEAR